LTETNCIKDPPLLAGFLLYTPLSSSFPRSLRIITSHHLQRSLPSIYRPRSRSKLINI